MNNVCAPQGARMVVPSREGITVGGRGDCWEPLWTPGIQRICRVEPTACWVRPDRQPWSEKEKDGRYVAPVLHRWVKGLDRGSAAGFAPFTMRSTRNPRVVIAAPQPSPVDVLRDKGCEVRWNAEPVAPAPTKTRGADVAPAVDRDARRGVTEFQASEGITGSRGDATLGLTVRPSDNDEGFIVVVKGDEKRATLRAGQRAPESVRGKITVESSLRAGRLPPRAAAMPGRPGRGASLVGCDGVRIAAWAAVTAAETECSAAWAALPALDARVSAAEAAYVAGTETWAMLCSARSERARGGERATAAVLSLRSSMRELCALDRAHEVSIEQRPAQPAGAVKRVKHRGKRPAAPTVTRR